MKLLITNINQQVVEGYHIVDLSNGESQLNDVVNNSCTDVILSSNCLESVDKETAKTVLNTACQKVRLKGSISVAGIELKNLCRDTLNNSLSSDEFNNIIKDVKSILTSKEVCDQLRSMRLQIDTTVVQGHVYDIKASRPN